jgi:hypothetical protein
MAIKATHIEILRLKNGLGTMQTNKENGYLIILTFNIIGKTKNANN